jgi:F-type H+-transporting ATPase subunit gamma
VDRPEAPPSDTLVVFTSDTGLCGSYNANLIQLADRTLAGAGASPPDVVFIGKKGHRYFTRRGVAPAGAYLDLAGRPNSAKADDIGRALMQRFLSGQTGRVSLLYSRFISAMVYRPTIQQWLPIALKSPAAGAEPETGGRHESEEYIFEPSAEQVFADLLPRWALAKFQLILLEAFTSEHSARMIAMKNATDNAQELLNVLTNQRNRIRQAAITKELSEIVGTVEALK